MQQVTIEGSTINEAWFRAIKACVEYGDIYTIDKGEYEGQCRKEFDLAVVHITRPYRRPLACETPNLSPTSDEKIESYFHKYLMDPYFSNYQEFKENEYKYSSWIAPIWEHCCQLLLKGKGGCNQATISLGKGPGDPTTFQHPPCLRVIDMRLKGRFLHFFVYFRSWDLIGGFPENLGGIQLLKEHCLQYINEVGGHDYQDGSLVCMSKGLHIYDHYWPLAADISGEYIDEGINVLQV